MLYDFYLWGLYSQEKSKNVQIYRSLRTSNKSRFNSDAGGMAIARPYGFEIDFVRNPFSGSAAWFFVIILKFILTPIIEIKIHEKLLENKKKHFRSPIFINLTPPAWELMISSNRIYLQSVRNVPLNVICTF